MIKVACFVLPPVLFACAPPASRATTANAGYGYELVVDSPNSSPQTSVTAATETNGKVSPEAVRDAVRARFGEVRTCYQSGLERDPKLSGLVRVRSVFGPDGVTRAAADEGSTLPDKAVVGCIVGVFQTISYPKAKRGDATIVYPIAFAP